MEGRGRGSRGAEAEDVWRGEVMRSRVSEDVGGRETGARKDREHKLAMTRAGSRCE